MRARWTVLIVWIDITPGRDDGNVGCIQILNIEGDINDVVARRDDRFFGRVEGESREISVNRINAKGLLVR